MAFERMSTSLHETSGNPIRNQISHTKYQECHTKTFLRPSCIYTYLNIKVKTGTLKIYQFAYRFVEFCVGSLHFSINSNLI
jgi:hypothetical protein